MLQHQQRGSDGADERNERRNAGKHAPEFSPADRQVADQLSGLPVHGKEEVLSLPLGIEHPHGHEGVMYLAPRQIRAAGQTGAGILINIYSKKVSPVVLSGTQFTMGGVVLTLIGIGMGGHLGNITAVGVVIIFYLAMVSAVAYTLWSVLLAWNDVSKVAIFGFVNPLCSVILSALILGEVKQAFNTVNIYSDILTGTMDAFASIISNNVNAIMKRMTSLSITLMIPTLIASFYGMNVDIHLEEMPYAFALIILCSVVLSTLAFIVFRKIKWF